jgi:hypothetical protein
MKVSTFRKGGRVNMAPVAQNRSSHQSGKNTMRFRECERIATIPGAVSFTVVDTIQCNPGLSTSFPWLSGHAALFENYRVHKLVYRYKNLKGTSSAGNVIMSFDYDTLDSAPTNAIAATQSTHYVDGAPWRIFQLNVPTDKRNLFTRSNTPAGADLKTYDMGALHISCEGCADTSDHGYLEVEYDIEFFNKQSSSSTSPPSTGSSAAFYLSAPQSLNSNQIVAYDTEITNSLGIVNTAGSFSIPAGTYRYDVVFYHTGGTVNGVRMFVNGVAFAPAQQVVFAGAVTAGTIHQMFGVFTLANTSLVTCDVLWGTVSSAGSDVNKIQFTRI